MKRFVQIIICLSLASHVEAQQDYYDVNSGNGKGIRFWSSENYKIHMGIGSTYQYGPVTDYSIKMNMTTTTGRGWTWGSNGAVPVAALNNLGQMKIAGYFEAGSSIWAPSFETRKTDYTKIQLATYDWSGSHALLFNAYKNITVSSNLGATGNTRFANNEGGYSGGAGGIFFYGNGGYMDFNISPAAGVAGGDTDINWGTPKMRIQRNGNVGIGTTSPAAKLDILAPAVSGGEFIQLMKIDDATSDYLKIANATGANGQFIPNVYGYHESDERQALYLTGAIGSSNDSGAQPIMVFDSRISTSAALIRPLFAWDSYGNRKMLLTADGKLGIGTTNPDEKLTVNGNIHTKEVRVDLSVPGPDYVFADNYELTTLEEVEDYIKTNKHLPEIPSAKEMEANGVELGEMNMLLLKKIEELTLYILDQEKRIRELEKKN